jgi:hypothetical protein
MNLERCTLKERGTRKFSPTGPEKVQKFFLYLRLLVGKCIITCETETKNMNYSED